MKSVDELFSKATKLGIEIKWAKNKMDGGIGIHVRNPKVSSLEYAIIVADEKELKKVTIHNIYNWPYPLNKDFVVVEY